MAESLKLYPITFSDIECFDGSEYQNLSDEKKQDLIMHSNSANYSGNYFKFFLLKMGDCVVGFINIYAHDKSVVSIAPEIKMQYRRKGFAEKGLILAYEFMKGLGYSVVVADINNDNIASQRLHEKLGFKIIKRYINKNNKEMILYKKTL